MESIKKCYTVVIGGVQYSLVADEPEGEVMRSIKLVDDLIKQVSQGVPHADRARIILLIALRLANRALRAEDDLLKVTVAHEALIKTLDSCL